LSDYQIAGICLHMVGTGEALRCRMLAYETENETADMVLVVNREELLASGKKYPNLSLDEWEYIRTGSAFGCRMPDFDGFCLHASAVVFKGKAVLFSGPCGIGKSTHTSLWQQYFGPERAVILNDDKPVLRLIKDTFYACGTPWSGKSPLNRNQCIPLHAIVFLKQAGENKIRRLSVLEAVRLMVYQSMRPEKSRKLMEGLLNLIGTLLEKIPVYELECTVSFAAVELAYQELYHNEIQMEGNDED